MEVEWSLSKMDDCSNNLELLLCCSTENGWLATLQAKLKNVNKTFWAQILVASGLLVDPKQDKTGTSSKSMLT